MCFEVFLQINLDYLQQKFKLLSKPTFPLNSALPLSFLSNKKPSFEKSFIFKLKSEFKSILLISKLPCSFVRSAKDEFKTESN